MSIYANHMIEILTAILVVITAFYAWVTFRIQRANEGVLQEMRRQYNELRRPSILITPKTSHTSLIYLSVQNTGPSAARDFSLTIDRDFYRFGKKTDDMNLKGNLIDHAVSFAPKAELLFYLAQGFVIFEKPADHKLTPPVFVITAKYTYLGESFTEETTIDLKAYLNCAVPHDPIVDELEKITDAIKKKQQPL